MGCTFTIIYCLTQLRIYSALVRGGGVTESHCLEWFQSWGRAFWGFDSQRWLFNYLSYFKSFIIPSSDSSLLYNMLFENININKLLKISSWLNWLVTKVNLKQHFCVWFNNIKLQIFDWLINNKFILRILCPVIFLCLEDTYFYIYF